MIEEARGVESAPNGPRLATAPVNWNNNDLPGWRPVVPFPDILDRMRDAGYTATEYDAAFGTDIKKLRAEACCRNLDWTGSYQWIDFLDTGSLDHTIRRLMPTFELLDAIDCRNLIVSDVLRPQRVAMAGRIPPDGSQSLSPHDVQSLAASLHRVAREASSHNVTVRYHNHVGTWIETPAEISALLSVLDISLVQLCFDTGHYAYGGGDPSRFISQYHDCIGYLHLKDVDTRAIADARSREMTFIDALKEYVFSPIGAGSADIPAILQALLENDYDGWIVVEQDTCKGDPTEIARANLDFIRNWLEARC